MAQWEYCLVALTWRHGFGNHRYTQHLVYYTPSGGRAEEKETDIEAGDMAASYAIGRALQYLGAEGWELVTVQHEVSETGFTWHSEAWLKRQVSTDDLPES